MERGGHHEDEQPVKELPISNMLEIEALRQLLFERGIITEEDLSISSRSWIGR